MKYFVSERNYEKYKPQTTAKQRLLALFKKPRTVGRVHDRDIATLHHNLIRQNPYQQKPKSSRSRLKWILFTLIVLIWLGLILYLPYFQIKKVNITGLKIIKPDEINTLIQQKHFNKHFVWAKKNFFIISTKKISQEISDEFAVEKIVINKIFPGELNITIEEKISSIIYDNGSGYYLLDQTGNVIKNLAPVMPDEYIVTNVISTSTISTTNKIKLADSSISSTVITNKVHVPNYTKIKSEFGNLPILYDTRNITSTEKQILPNSVIAGVIKINQEAEKQGIANIKYHVLENPLGGIMAATDKSWTFYYNPIDNIDAQLNNLKNIIKNNQPRSYIDLRYGNRIYWQ